MAVQSELHENYIRRVESGDANPSFTALDMMLEAMGVTWAEFGREIDRAKKRARSPTR